MYQTHAVEAFNIDLYASQKTSRIFSQNRMKVREYILSYMLSIQQCYFGTGHVCCRPKLVDAFENKWDFVTLLRNPIDRWISEYVYNTYKNNDWEKNSLPIDDFLLTKKARDTGISFIRYFSSMPSDYVGDCNDFVDEAVGNLERFSVVGIVENLDNWCISFEERFNKTISIPLGNISPNVHAKNEIRSNDLIMQKIEMLCEPDIRVYQRIVEQINQKSNEIKNQRQHC